MARPRRARREEVAYSLPNDDPEAGGYRGSAPPRERVTDHHHGQDPASEGAEPFSLGAAASSFAAGILRASPKRRLQSPVESHRMRQHPRPHHPPAEYLIRPCADVLDVPLPDGEHGRFPAIAWEVPPNLGDGLSAHGDVRR